MLSARNITKSFRQGDQELKIIKSLNLELGPGDDVCILGPSGAGKSTFLHILGTLERATSGEVLYRGENLSERNDDQLAKFRNQKIGFVFQFHYLLSEFTALENVMMPGRIGGWSVSECRRKAGRLLDQMGLTSRTHHYPSEMSGGEQQRVAIARALICEPEILMADEPTGNLDIQNSKLIQDLFFQLKKEHNLTLVAVTHDQQFAGRFARQLRMEDGHWATGW